MYVYILSMHHMNHFHPSSFYQLNYPFGALRFSFLLGESTPLFQVEPHIRVDAQEIVDFLSQRLLER